MDNPFMEQINNLQGITRELILNYDARIVKIGDVITSTYDILEDCRERRKRVRENLKNTFARTKSLRKKDFDFMLQDLMHAQTECEDQIKDTIRIFTHDYKNLVTKFLETLTTGKIEQSIDAFSRIEVKQKDIQNTLLDFRKEQEEIANNMKSFLENTERVRIKDFRKMIHKIRDHQRDRNEKIRQILADVAEEHSQMRTIWNEIPEDKQRSWNEKVSLSE
jgi:sulfite reductase alpha subunit-like flavoprotein